MEERKANSDYNFEQIANGTVKGYFSQAQDTGYSKGVATLQNYLKAIGYVITDPAGRFQDSTRSAVENFQWELGITKDGIAGESTCFRLNIVRSSTYYTKYGHPLTDAQWGPANILNGNFGDVDLLARIILAESGYDNLLDEKGVAIVLKNRSVNTSSLYWASASLNPDASIYARVVANGYNRNKPTDYKNIHYQTCLVPNSTAQNPRRGFGGDQKADFIDPAWKNAVDLATAIVNGTSISVSAYKVSGRNVTTTKMTISTISNKNYLNQIAWNHYISWYNAGSIDTSVQPLTFSDKSGDNVICKAK